jgi:hypothetical protein
LTVLSGSIVSMDACILHDRLHCFKILFGEAMSFKIQCIPATLVTSCLLAFQHVQVFSMEVLSSNINLISENSVVQPAPKEEATDKPIPKKSSTPDKPANGAPNSENPTKEPLVSPEKPVSLFSGLQKALTQKNYREADQLTYQLILESAGPISKSQGRLNKTEWGQFPCSDFKEIDRLWREATEGAQGFSVQKEIFIESKSVAQAFQTRIGWRDTAGKWVVISRYSAANKTVEYEKGKEPEFNKPPRGHLPAKLAWEGANDHRFDKIYACKL